MGKSEEYSEVYALSRLAYYNNLGITLWMEDNKLKFRACKDKLSPAIMEKLKRDKEILIHGLAYKEVVENDYFPLTPIQTAYIAGGENNYELGDTNAHYYTEYTIDNIDIGLLQNAINWVIKTNDALRLLIEADGRQRVLKKVPIYSIETCRRKEDIRTAWSHHRYRLGEWPMFHFEVSQDEIPTLHFSFDCLIMDAFSAALMLDQIFSIYNGEAPKRSKLQFEDYMRNIYMVTNKINTKAEAYWTERVKKMPGAPKLAYRKKFDEVEKTYFKRLEYEFSRKETQKLYDRLKDLFITPSACMCTIFMKVLSVYSDEKELTVTLTLFNRAPVHKDINLVLGDFTNIGFASYYVAKDATFLEELRETSKQFWKLVEFHSYDGTRVLKEMSRSIPGKAVMPIVFTSVLQGKLKSREELSYHDSFTISQTPQTAIDHQLRDDGEGMRLSWDYIEELFDEIDIQKMFDTYIGFTRRIIEADDWKCRLEVEKI